MEAVLKVSDLTKRFSGLTAVNNVNFEVRKGEVFGLIGPNGAGKTTVFNLLTGIYKPTSGNIVFDGKSIVGMKPHEIAKLGCCRTFQNLRLFKKESVFENVCIASQLNTTDYSFIDAIFKTRKFNRCEKAAKEKAHECLKFVGLDRHSDDNALSLPYGLQRKLEIARALASNPKLLLFDEPAAGMNPDESLVLMKLIEEIRKNFDVSILLIEHHMEVVMGICDRILVLNFGTQIATGIPSEIQKNQEVIDAYLGREEDT